MFGLPSNQGRIARTGGAARMGPYLARRRVNRRSRAGRPVQMDQSAPVCSWRRSKLTSSGQRVLSTPCASASFAERQWTACSFRHPSAPTYASDPGAGGGQPSPWPGGLTRTHFLTRSPRGTYDNLRQIERTRNDAFCYKSPRTIEHGVQEGDSHEQKAFVSRYD